MCLPVAGPHRHGCSVFRAVPRFGQAFLYPPNSISPHSDGLSRLAIAWFDKNS